MSDDIPSWMAEEDGRAVDPASKGQATNSDAPQLVRVKRAPPRTQKAFYLQKKYAEAFDDFAYKQKKKTGQKAPELVEEALKLLLDKYGETTKTL